MMKVEERDSFIVTISSDVSVDEMREILEKEYDLTVMRITSVNQGYYNQPGGRPAYQNPNDPIRPRAFKPDEGFIMLEVIYQKDFSGPADKYFEKKQKEAEKAEKERLKEEEKAKDEAAKQAAIDLKKKKAELKKAEADAARAADESNMTGDFQG